MDCNNVNKRILELCKQKGWSEYKLAQESHIPNSSINAMFKKDHVPTVHNLQKICNAFQITLSQFFCNCLFEKTNNTELFIQLWDELPTLDKELVITYMHGLLKRPIKMEDGKNNDIR